jgi:hypothetical protein
MKNLRTVIAGLCLLLTCYVASAQSPLNEPDRNKPLLFAGMPDRIPVSLDYINSLFESEQGRIISLPATQDVITASFDGVVISSSRSVDGHNQSVLVRSTNFNGANFQVIKYTDVDGTVSYMGRILSFRHGDAYELKTEVGNLVLVKRSFHSLVAE